MNKTSGTGGCRTKNSAAVSFFRMKSGQQAGFLL
jgi:hypothetical protein